MIGDTYYEIKGRRGFKYLDDQTIQKIKQFRKNLKVLFYKEMKHILEYVIFKFGKDFYKLYQKEE